MGEKNQGEEESEGRKIYFLETRNNPVMTKLQSKSPVTTKIHLKLSISTVSTLERNYFHKNFSIEFCPSSFMILRLSCPHWSQEKRMISIDQTKHSNPGAGSKLERHSHGFRTILPCYLKANMFVGLGRRKIPSTKPIFHFNGHLLL